MHVFRELYVNLDTVKRVTRIGKSVYVEWGTGDDVNLFDGEADDFMRRFLERMERLNGR